MSGSRAGAASLALKLRLGAVGAELNAHYDRCKRTGQIEGTDPDERLALGNLWMLHQDLLGFALLGDPAIRLPLASGEGEPATATPAERGAADPGPGTAGAEGASRRAEIAVDPEALDHLERAALAVAGGDSPGVVAAQHGMVRSELVEAAEAYRAAGRAALSELLARREPEKGRGG
jgi:hypothetical protein